MTDLTVDLIHRHLGSVVICDPAADCHTCDARRTQIATTIRDALAAAGLLADPLIAHLVTTAHQWHAAYEADASPTALADGPGYRQARVALSDAVYRLINAGRLPEHQRGPLSATPPEPAGGEQDG